MKINVSFILVFAILLSCQQKQKADHEHTININLDDLVNTKPIEIQVPDNYVAIETVDGDLNQDGIAERVIAYNTPTLTEFGHTRVLHIFKKEAELWKLWHISTGAILSSDHGGTMGDPFQSLELKEGTLSIFHTGGSRIKWSFNHTFKYQNEDWKLINVTTVTGAPCDYWEDFNFNLLTKKVTLKKEIETCIDDESDVTTKIKDDYTFTVKLDELPSMDGFYPGNNLIEIPDTDRKIYY